MVDPVFGPLRFQAAGFWEGNVLFSPTQSTIEVIVNAGRDGPSESQRSFMKDLEVRYPSIWTTVVSALREAAERIQGKVQYTVDAFHLAGIEVPEAGAPSRGWSLSYTCDADGWHYEVLMKDWSPREVVPEC
jgi:hypothetical protein